MGFLVCLAGIVFVWLMQRSYRSAVETRNWPQVKALVIKSEILERVPQYGGPTETSAHVSYRYDWQGESYESERISNRGQYWSHQQVRAKEVVKKFPRGEWAECHVNPKEPSIAVLEHETKAAGYSIWFPGIFVIGGMGMMAGVFLKKKSA